GIYKAESLFKEKTYAEKQIAGSLLDSLYQRIHIKEQKETSEKFVVRIEGTDFMFREKKLADEFQKQANNFLHTDHAEVFLEEPESNLFPPTQFQLMNWILEIVEAKKRKNFFVIATHSPYVLSHLLQENLDDFGLYLTYPVGNGLYSVKTANDDDVQDIYDNGSDAFFNFEAFTER
ncbi:MAG: ATP-binding protein, partial [Alphaproteobacteria bacterium]|nr:ATP-binding protein [Alphaproteobacteria bacterium]